MPTHIAKYEILRHLGQGAMGEVFLARDPLIGREVAIKTIAQPQVQGAADRFLREARAAGQLSHPNLVTIHEFGEDQGLLYLVMEYLPGEDLHALLARKALSPREVLEVLAQVCDGLAYAHARGVLHRDIKPSNIRVSRVGGKLQAKVLDFGIARVTGSDLTGTGTLLGTFGYMAPEYIQSGQPDPRSDLFAVGVILYEALAGERPFTGDSTATVLYRVVHDPPPPLRPQALVGISPAVRAVLAMALAKDPEDRYLTAEALAANLRSGMDPAWRGVGGGARTAVVAAEPPVARPSVLPTPAVPPDRRILWLGTAVLVVVAGAVAYVGMRKPAAAAPAAVARPPVVMSPPPAEVPSAATADSVGTLEEAAVTLDRDPKAALGFIDRFLVTDPRNPRAWALKLVAHYELDDVEGVRATLQEAEGKGIPPKVLLLIPRVRQMLKQEAESPKLPADLHGRLLEGPAPDLPRRRLPLKGFRS